jgi:hypothetical protein
MRARARTGTRVRIGAVLAATCSGLILMASCGNPSEPSPLQSPVQTPTPQATIAVQPTATNPPPPPTPAGAPTSSQLDKTITPAPTVVGTPFLIPTVDRLGTPNTQATNQAVIATITAQAAPPTPPPTSRPGSNVLRPVGAGPSNRVPPTATPLASGVELVSKSERIFPGGAATLSIRTRPEAVCVLQVAHLQSDGTIAWQPIADGAARTAGSDGVIAWIWIVGQDEPAGSLSLMIDCGDAGAAQFAIEVTK